MCNSLLLFYQMGGANQRHGSSDLPASTKLLQRDFLKLHKVYLSFAEHVNGRGPGIVYDVGLGQYIWNLIPGSLPLYAPGKLTVAGLAFPPPVTLICAHSM